MSQLLGWIQYWHTQARIRRHHKVLRKSVSDTKITTKEICGEGFLGKGSDDYEQSHVSQHVYNWGSYEYEGVGYKVQCLGFWVRRFEVWLHIET